MAPSESVENRVIPGGGDFTRRQSMRMKDQNLTFTVDANELSEPLLEGNNGAKFEWVLGPKGNASGAVSKTGQGFANWDGPSYEYDGEATYDVTVEGDGAIVRGTF